MDKHKTISIKLHASLAAYTPAGVDSPTFDAEITDGMTVKQLLVQLAIPHEIIKMISLNDKLVKNSANLSGGDQLILFSTIAGG